MTGTGPTSPTTREVDTKLSAEQLRARWLSSRRPRSDTTLDLYCFAHAGGSAGEFLRWSADLPGIRLWAVKLPGRVPRQAEEPYTRVADLVSDLVEQVDFGQRDFAFFGHSLGALIAFETARALRRNAKRPPRRLLLSSMPPPPFTTRGTAHQMPDAELLAVIEQRWGGLPQVVDDDSELRALALQHLRADAVLAETYSYVPGEPLDLPFTVFAGDEEDSGQLDWRAHTLGSHDAHVLRGGHFYFRDQGSQRELLRLVADALNTNN